MLNPFVCGTFHDQDEDLLACSSPRKPKKKNNPYSNRGLDKFSALLEDLNQRRQKLYSQMNPHDISFVRFAYTKNDDIVPIVVKVKNKEQRKHKSEELRPLEQLEKPSEPSVAEDRNRQTKLEHSHDVKNFGFSWNNFSVMLRRPSFYVPLAMILILVFLTVFGRSVATLCTCLVWYVIPILSEPKALKNKKKRDYVRGLSEKKLMNNNEGLLSSNDTKKSSAKHAHQKSW